MICISLHNARQSERKAKSYSIIKYRFPAWGWISKGRKTEGGGLPDNYKLKGIPTYNYPKRTEQNIIDSDRTVIISHGKLPGSSKLTQELDNKYNRPCLHIDLNKTHAFFQPQLSISVLMLFFSTHITSPDCIFTAIDHRF
jgi:Circularly permutated YpsA SLOG family